MSTPKPVVLCILDGWGHRVERTGNAPALAHTPVFDRLMASYPNNLLITHGPDVGLPSGQMGNSEVGHTNIGAGRVVAMDLGQIDLAVENGSFYQRPALIDFIARLKDSGGTAHLLGLASDGGVHGHILHLLAAVRAITDAGVQVALHILTDGRDVSPRSAYGYVNQIIEALPEGATIATVTGRYFALDRDHRWERISEAYRAIVLGDGIHARDAQAAITAAYNRSESDEFITATVIGSYIGAQDGDGVMCLNFRADRAREILSAIGDPDFDAFDIGARPTFAALLGMVEYSEIHNGFMNAVFPSRDIVNTLGHWVSINGKRQFRLAETEKYPHVTFFLNGGREGNEVGESRSMPNSPKVATYDLQPEMSCEEVTDLFVAAIRDGYDLIVTNYANPDMVGHTGNLDAAISACEAVDRGLGRVAAALEEVGGAMLLTADHGNCEVMIDPETGGPHTAHTTNPVPVILIGGPPNAQLRSGRLADVAPTLLDMMDMEVPPEMTGRSLIT